MTVVKNKYLGVAWLTFCALLIGSGGFVWWHAKHRPQPSRNLENLAADATSGAAVPSQLNVNSPSLSSSIGQLGTTTGQNPTGSTNSKSAGSSNASLPDPSTFAQYDKYKDGDQALFGDIQVGTGAALGNNQKAAVYYTGFLTNGQVFDQSKTDAGGKLQAFVFTEGAHQVIPGWEEGLAGMKVGGVRLLIVPPAAGYGSAGQGPVPPNAVLVFEVQLLEVQ